MDVLCALEKDFSLLLRGRVIFVREATVVFHDTNKVFKERVVFSVLNLQSRSSRLEGLSTV